MANSIIEVNSFTLFFQNVEKSLLQELNKEKCNKLDNLIITTIKTNEVKLNSDGNNENIIKTEEYDYKFIESLLLLINDIFKEFNSLYDYISSTVPNLELRLLIENLKNDFFIKISHENLFIKVLFNFVICVLFISPELISLIKDSSSSFYTFISKVLNTNTQNQISLFVSGILINKLKTIKYNNNTSQNIALKNDNVDDSLNEDNTNNNNFSSQYILEILELHNLGVEILIKVFKLNGELISSFFKVELILLLNKKETEVLFNNYFFSLLEDSFENDTLSPIHQIISFLRLTILTKQINFSIIEKTDSGIEYYDNFINSLIRYYDDNTNKLKKEFNYDTQILEILFFEINLILKKKLTEIIKDTYNQEMRYNIDKIILLENFIKTILEKFLNQLFSSKTLNLFGFIDLKLKFIIQFLKIISNIDYKHKLITYSILNYEEDSQVFQLMLSYLNLNLNTSSLDLFIKPSDYFITKNQLNSQTEAAIKIKHDIKKEIDKLSTNSLIDIRDFEYSLIASLLRKLIYEESYKKEKIEIFNTEKIITTNLSKIKNKISHVTKVLDNISKTSYSNTSYVLQTAISNIHIIFEEEEKKVLEENHKQFFSNEKNSNWIIILPSHCIPLGSKYLIDKINYPEKVKNSLKNILDYYTKSINNNNENNSIFNNDKDKDRKDTLQSRKQVINETSINIYPYISTAVTSITYSLNITLDETEKIDKKSTYNKEYISLNLILNRLNLDEERLSLLRNKISQSQYCKITLKEKDSKDNKFSNSTSNTVSTALNHIQVDLIQATIIEIIISNKKIKIQAISNKLSLNKEIILYTINKMIERKFIIIDNTLEEIFDYELKINNDFIINLFESYLEKLEEEKINFNIETNNYNLVENTTNNNSINLDDFINSYLDFRVNYFLDIKLNDSKLNDSKLSTINIFDQQSIEEYSFNHKNSNKLKDNEKNNQTNILFSYRNTLVDSILVKLIKKYKTLSISSLLDLISSEIEFCEKCFGKNMTNNTNSTTNTINTINQIEENLISKNKNSNSNYKYIFSQEKTNIIKNQLNLLSNKGIITLKDDLVNYA